MNPSNLSTIKTLDQSLHPSHVQDSDIALHNHLQAGWSVLNVTVAIVSDEPIRYVTLQRAPVVADLQAQVDHITVMLNNLPFLNNVTPQTLLPAVKKLADEWETCNRGYAPKQTTFNNDLVFITGGRNDDGAFHRAIMIARDLLTTGKWDGKSQLWVCDPYAMYNRLERDINTAVMRQVNNEWYVSHSADALELILEGMTQHA